MRFDWPPKSSIDFPSFVSVTVCETVTRSHLVDTPHGKRKVLTPELTFHGRFMAGFRAAELASATPVVPVHRTVHRGRKLAS